MITLKHELYLLAFFASLIACPALAFGEDREAPKQAAAKLRSDLWYHLAAMPLYAWIELNFHEGSHALATAAMGYRVTAYKPWPHHEAIKIFDGYDHNGNKRWREEKRFVFGNMKADGDFSREQKRLITAAPTLANVAIFGASDLLLRFIDQRSTVAMVLYVGGMVWPFIDYAANYLGVMNDAREVIFGSSSFWAQYALTAAYGIVWIAGLYRLIKRSLDILFVADMPREKRNGVVVAPLAGTGRAGVVLIGQW